MPAIAPLPVSDSTDLPARRLTTMPEEAVRRKEPLDRAAAILAKGEAEGQLTD
jgi:hypothetical protein